ncbi:MAG TPA: hypothetical protein DCF68_10085 [Cyanothece sp. UBA12306]|nr:hypothetical protein [Cyanothece sp. UBA12306]
MKNQLLLSLGITATIVSPVTFGTEQAVAGEICNARNQILFVAGAYTNEDDVWVTKAWWEVEPGECLSYPDNWYTYIEVSRHETAARPDVEDKDFETVELCVLQDKQTIYNAIYEGECDRNDYGFTDNSMQTFYSIGPRREVVK